VVKLRAIAFLAAFFLISLLAVNLAIKRVVPFWAAKARKNIAIRAVELFWEKGVRLVWEGGYKESPPSYGLSTRIGILVPGSPNQIYVEISYGR